MITAVLTLTGLDAAVAAPEQRCDSEAFGKLIDETAQILRNLNRDSEQRFQERLRAKAKAKGWSENEIASRSMSAMDDSRLTQFNTEIEELVSQLDRLSVTPKGDMSCQRLSDLRAVRDKLVAVMGQKSGFVLAQIDNDQGPASAPATPNTSGKSAPLATPSTAAREASPAPEAPVSPPSPPATSNTAQATAPGPAQPPQTPGNWRPPSWSPAVASAPQATAPRTTPAPRPQDPPPLSIRPGEITPDQKDGQSAEPASLPPVVVTSDGYTIQEIRDASQGVFGKITSELGGVLTYAFRKFGTPNGFIIGDEGGGAFLAGLRYGEGDLHTRIGGRDRPVERIYWQGPSVGLDFGATGSRTLFLVYNLNDVSQMYERFPGLDGSAYVAGGVGLTVFAKDKIVILPIRTGLGLRIGASVAYLKFTQKRKWNPF
jgi:hypothetical protein